MKKMQVASFGAAFAILLSGSAVHAKLLFKDDFSSGDLSAKNDYFRWGRSGKLIKPTGESTRVVTAPGPNSEPSKMLQFRYGTWQEVRFHLTETKTEKRTEKGVSDVAYPELWVRFSMRVPENYFHHLTDGTVPTSNNKGWIFVWNGNYQDPPVANRFEWWPVSGPESALGNSIVSTGQKYHGGHDTSPDYIRPLERVSTDGKRAWAITKQERGQWIDYAFHFRVASSPKKNDGLIEVWKDGERAIAWRTQSWPRDGNPAHAGFDRGYLMGYHNAPVTETTIFYIDDFRIGTTAVSIGLSDEASDAASFANVEPKP